MGLKLRYYLFHGVTSGDVSGTLQAFYAGRGRPLIKVTEDSENTLDVHAANNKWVVVELDIGWEWKERREALRFVSERLWCPAFLVFVYDGEYWAMSLLPRLRNSTTLCKWGTKMTDGFLTRTAAATPRYWFSISISSISP